MSAPPRSPRAVVGVLAAGALLGAALVLHATAVFGPGAAQLAVHHFTAAEALRHGESMTLSRGEPFIMWPPLMPVLLAILRSFGLEYPTAGLVLHVVSHAAALFLAPLLVLRLFGRPWIAFVVLAALLVSSELFYVAENLQTEAPFHALVFGGLLAIVRYTERPTTGRLLAATAIALLACLQRYPGAALVATLFVLVLRYPVSVPWRTRLVRAIASSFVAILPLAIWMVRCRFAARSWGIMEVAPEVPASTNVKDAIHVLALFLNPRVEEGSWRWRVNVGVALLLGAFLLVRIARARDAEERRPFAVYLAFFPAYLAVLLVSTSSMNLDPITHRYVVPVYPILWGGLALGAAEATGLLRRISSALAVAAGAALLALFALHLSTSWSETRDLVVNSRREGTGGFASPAWMRSELVAWLRTNGRSGEFWSNMPEVVIHSTSRRAKYAAPDRFPALLAELPVGAFLVWVHHLPQPPPQLDPAALAGRGRRLALVAKLDLGIVYRVEDEP